MQQYDSMLNDNLLKFLVNKNRKPMSNIINLLIHNKLESQASKNNNPPSRVNEIRRFIRKHRYS